MCSVLRRIEVGTMVDPLEQNMKKYIKKFGLKVRGKEKVMKMNLKLSQPLNCFSYQSMNTVRSKKVRFLEMKPKACNTMMRLKTESHRKEWEWEDFKYCNFNSELL